MKTKSIIGGIVMLSVVASFSLPVSGAPEPQQVYPTAIFSFNERGTGIRGYGDKIGDILFASLSANPDMYLVDRAEMQKVLDEHELNLSGMVTPGQATQIGQLTGAKILITGSVIESGKNLYLVTKIIGTETSRVLGASMKGKTTDDLGSLVEKLADKVAKTVTQKSSELVAKKLKMEDRIAALKKKLGDSKKPSVFIKVTERHIGQATIDPAAQTELILMCKETGFDVVDPEKIGAKEADIVIKGEGFSEFAMRKGNLVSVKARLEVEAVDAETDRVIAVDRQTAVVVDLTEQIAGKKALQDAAATVAERMLPKLVTKAKAKAKPEKK
jgi:TolB-like protein